MSRPIFNCSAESPYHVYARCINKEWFRLPMPSVWNIMEMQLHFITHAFQVKIHAFVLMNNHFHMIISSPEANLSDAMAWFMRETSRWITADAKRINQTWSGRFNRCELTCYHYYLNTYKYLYQNPLRANICDDVLRYPYSTLPGTLGLQPIFCPTTEDPLLMESTESTLHWLNTLPGELELESMRKALRRRTFKLPKINARANPLETNLL